MESKLMRAGAVVIVLLLWGCESHVRRRDGGDGRGSEASGASGKDNDGGNSHTGATAGAGTSSGGAAAEAGRTAQSGAGGASSPAGAGAPASDAGTDDGAAGMQAPAESCLDDIADYAELGPFSFSSERAEQLSIWVPHVPEGCKVPVVHFSSGTGAPCASYAPLLEHLASHGFLTACRDASPDDGTQCLASLRTLFEEYPDLADMKIGMAGHEAGGAVAIACVQRAEDEWGYGTRYAGHAAAPFYGAGPGNWMAQFAQIESPIFMFNGSLDVLTSERSVLEGYNALGTEKYWYEATGANFIPLPFSWAAESAVVFFRWQLLDDAAAGDYFAHMPDGDQWDLQAQSAGP